MSTPREATEQRPVRPGGVRIGTVRGVELWIDVSVLVVFALVVWSLGSSAFPGWHPDWGLALTWATAAAAGVMFLASILLHELAHTFVAKAFGIPVPRVTLYLFGGVSELGEEPDRPGKEFLVAVVGPVTSIGLGIACTVAALVLAGEGFSEAIAASPADAFAALSPAATVLLWLGTTNLVLGVFNLVPGFPLDGGRLLRAVFWKVTGSLVKATRWASFAGQGVGVLLILWGLVEVMAGAVISGLWLALIGWFLIRAARASYAQVFLREALKGLRVRDLMRTRFDVVQGDPTLDQFVEECVVGADQAAWPVEDRGRTVGLVLLQDVLGVPEAQRPFRRVRDVLRPVGPGIPPDTDGRDALQALITVRDPLPVVEDGHIVGLLHGADVLRWLALHREGLRTP